VPPLTRRLSPCLLTPCCQAERTRTEDASADGRGHPLSLFASQVFLQPDGDTLDVNGGTLPRLVYISREKRPGHDHNKKAGAMNALVRRAPTAGTQRRFLCSFEMKSL
jgi:hypothetical protein